MTLYVCLLAYSLSTWLFSIPAVYTCLFVSLSNHLFSTNTISSPISASPNHSFILPSFLPLHDCLSASNSTYLYSFTLPISRFHRVCFCRLLLCLPALLLCSHSSLMPVCCCCPLNLSVVFAVCMLPRVILRTRARTCVCVLSFCVICARVYVCK